MNGCSAERIFVVGVQVAAQARRATAGTRRRGRGVREQRRPARLRMRPEHPRRAAPASAEDAPCSACRPRRSVATRVSRPTSARARSRPRAAARASRRGRGDHQRVAARLGRVEEHERRERRQRGGEDGRRACPRCGRRRGRRAGSSPRRPAATARRSSSGVRSIRVAEPRGHERERRRDLRVGARPSAITLAETASGRPSRAVESSSATRLWLGEDQPQGDARAAVSAADDRDHAARAPYRRARGLPSCRDREDHRRARRHARRAASIRPGSATSPRTRSPRRSSAPAGCSTSAAASATATTCSRRGRPSASTSTPAALAGQERETVVADMRALPVRRRRASPRCSRCSRSSTCPIPSGSSRRSPGCSSPAASAVFVTPTG